MLRDNRTDRKETEIEEPIDIVLRTVSTALGFHTTIRLTVSYQYIVLLANLQLCTHRAKTLASNFRAWR